MTPLFLFNATEWDDWQTALNDHGWSILVIVAVLAAVQIVLTRVIARVFRAVLNSAPLRRTDDPEGLKRRADTLASTINWVLAIVVAFVGITLIMDEIGISVTALVAGVGVVGIAIGLGAQTLVKDVINGMFILIEDQFRVGDVVTVAGVSGVVIEINPRRTVVRDGDGNVHSIPNGSIVVATNQTQGFSRINLDIPLGYDASLEDAIAIIEEICSQLHHERPNDFLKAPVVPGVTAFHENKLVVKVTADVAAGKQWELANQLRRRIKLRLDAAGIPMTNAPSLSKAAVEKP